MLDVTHFTSEEGGLIRPFSEFVPGETNFNVLRFSDGSVWDATVAARTGSGWRGKLFPVGEFWTDGGSAI